MRRAFTLQLDRVVLRELLELRQSGEVKLHMDIPGVGNKGDVILMTVDPGELLVDVLQAPDMRGRVPLDAWWQWHNRGTSEPVGSTYRNSTVANRNVHKAVRDAFGGRVLSEITE